MAHIRMSGPDYGLDFQTLNLLLRCCFWAGTSTPQRAPRLWGSIAETSRDAWFGSLSVLIGFTSCIVQSFRSRTSFISSPLRTPRVYGPTSKVQHRFSSGLTFWELDFRVLACDTPIGFGVWGSGVGSWGSADGERM